MITEMNLTQVIRVGPPSSLSSISFFKFPKTSIIPKLAKSTTPVRLNVRRRLMFLLRLLTAKFSQKTSVGAGAFLYSNSFSLNVRGWNLRNFLHLNTFWMNLSKSLTSKGSISFLAFRWELNTMNAKLQNLFDKSE